MNINIRKWCDIDDVEKERLFARSELDISEVSAAVAEIIRKVETGGDAALKDLTAELTVRILQTFLSPLKNPSLSGRKALSVMR